MACVVPPGCLPPPLASACPIFFFFFILAYAFFVPTVNIPRLRSLQLPSIRGLTTRSSSRQYQ